MDLWRHALAVALKGISFRQQRLPPKDENMCVTVTAENFEQVVIRTDVDVLIIFYTPQVLVASCKKVNRDTDQGRCT